MAQNSSGELEAALPTLIEKLKAMQESLNDDEKRVFSDIIRSAAKHSEVIKAAGEGALEKIRYMKPMSVHATDAVREHLIGLPKSLDLSSE